MSATAKSPDQAILPFRETPDLRLGSFLKLATRTGWEIVNYDHVGVLLRKKKQYGAGYYFVGALTAIIGIGLLVWIAGWIEYAVSADRLVYIPMQDLLTSEAHELSDLLL